MRKYLLGLAATAMVLGGPAAVSLDGQTITLQGGDRELTHAPVSAPYSGPAPEGRVEVIHEATGESAPATVHAGALTFVPASIAAGENQAYRVVVHPENNPPRVHVEVDEDAGQAAVYVQGDHFTTYNFGEDMRMPILWPVHAEGGITITRNYPMGEDEVESTDHPHHMSMWSTHGDVNGYDFWHAETKVTRNLEAGSGDAYGWIRAENDWVGPDGDPVVAEERVYKFYNTPASGRLFDLSITLKAGYGDVEFGDTRETGLFAFRIRPEIQGNNAGVLTNANWDQTESEVWGLEADWMDYSGPVEGVGNRGIAAFAHPDNLRHPPHWHVRDYGLVASNPFGASEFPETEESGAYTLSEGEELTIQFRCYIHSGDVEEAGVAGHYELYANPLSAELE